MHGRNLCTGSSLTTRWSLPDTSIGSSIAAAQSGYWASSAWPTPPHCWVRSLNFALILRRSLQETLCRCSLNRTFNRQRDNYEPDTDPTGRSLPSLRGAERSPTASRQHRHQLIPLKRPEATCPMRGRTKRASGHCSPLNRMPARDSKHGRRCAQQSGRAATPQIYVSGDSPTSTSTATGP